MKGLDIIAMHENAIASAIANRIPLSIISTRVTFYNYRLPNYSYIKEQEVWNHNLYDTWR